MLDGERDRALCPGLHCHPLPVDSAEQIQTQALDPNQEQPQLHVWLDYLSFHSSQTYLTSQVSYEQIPITDEELARAKTESGTGTKDGTNLEVHDGFLFFQVNSLASGFIHDKEGSHGYILNFF